MKMCLSVSPGVLHETDLSSIGLRGRVRLGRRRTGVSCVHRVLGKEGQEDNVVLETGHWPPPWTCGGALGEQAAGLCIEASATVTVGMGFVLTDCTKHQKWEPEHAEEQEETFYADTWYPLCTF